MLKHRRVTTSCSSCTKPRRRAGHLGSSPVSNYAKSPWDSNDLGTWVPYGTYQKPCSCMPWSDPWNPKTWHNR
ncbi:hypothetical protein [Anaerosporobacter sp.]